MPYSWCINDSSPEILDWIITVRDFVDDTTLQFCCEGKNGYIMNHKAFIAAEIRKWSN